MSDMKINTVNPRGPVSGAEFVENLKTNSATTVSQPKGKEDFGKILDHKLDSVVPAELKFSAHAQSRLNSRGIDLSGEDIVKMQEAVEKARAKGSKESLLLTDKAAFVVSVKNNTVITAVDRDSLKENLFTNIDSTIMI